MAKCRKIDSKTKGKRDGRGKSKEKEKKELPQRCCPHCGGTGKRIKRKSQLPKPHYYRRWISRCFNISKGNGVDLTPQDTVYEAAQCWGCMTDEQRKNFKKDVDKERRNGGQSRRSSGQAPSSGNRPGFLPGPSNSLLPPPPSSSQSDSDSDIVSRPAPGSSIPRNPFNPSTSNSTPRRLGWVNLNNLPPPQPPPPNQSQSQYNIKSWKPGKSFP